MTRAVRTYLGACALLVLMAGSVLVPAAGSSVGDGPGAGSSSASPAPQVTGAAALPGAALVAAVEPAAPNEPATAELARPGARPSEARETMTAQAATAVPVEPLFSATGRVTLSVDAVGTLGSGDALVSVDKREGATVRRAFLFTATTGFSGYQPVDGEVSLNGSPIAWDPAFTIPTSISSFNALADVTALVKPVVDAAPAGTVDLAVNEGPNTSQYDGEILAVVFDDPSLPPNNTVVLMYGALDTTGDRFTIGLSEPVDLTDPDFGITMGLGISFGFQPAGQYSQVDVNGQRLTTAAGGQDDGEDGNGALITAGGLGDAPANPADPFATDACGDGHRCDDERNDLEPFMETGDTTIVVDTVNPSGDDNVFFVALDVRAAVAVVGEGVVLTPVEATNPVGTDHTLSATVQDDDGNPVVDREVTFTVTGGPNAGVSGAATTGTDGTATFTYTSDEVGTDTIVASFVDSLGEPQESNEATKTWVGSVCEEDGLNVLPGVASGLVHDTVEPLVPGLGGAVHGINCSVVVPLENAVDSRTGSAAP